MAYHHGSVRLGNGRDHAGRDSRHERELALGDRDVAGDDLAADQPEQVVLARRRLGQDPHGASTGRYGHDRPAGDEAAADQMAWTALGLAIGRQCLRVRGFLALPLAQTTVRPSSRKPVDGTVVPG